MKTTKVISCLLAATLIATTFAGCGDSASVSTDETAQKQEQLQTQDSRGTMAKVVSLEGDTITVLLADMPTGKGGGTPPNSESGSTDSAVQTDGNNPPSAPPDGGQKGAGGPQEGTMPDGQRQGGREIQFTGEQAVYTLSDDVKVTTGMGDSATEIDLSEVAADSVINFTTITDEDGNEVISSIQIME